jgi:hypothetical protein
VALPPFGARRLNVANKCGRNPFETNDITPKCGIGDIYEHKISADLGVGFFRYVRFLDAVAYARGHVCTYAVQTTGIPYRVTNDISGGSSVGQGVAGIACNVMTQNYYGFVQIGGMALVVGDGSVAAADYVVAHTVDGQADTFADGEEEQVFGYALDADSTANDPLATLNMFHCTLMMNCAH